MKKRDVGFSCNQASQHTDDIREKYKPYFSFDAVYFREGISYAFLGSLRYRLLTPARLIDDVLMVAWEDLRMIYGGKFAFTSDESGFEMAGGGATARIVPGKKILIDGREIDEVALELDGTLFVPVEGLMVTGFGKRAAWMRSYLMPGDYLGISDTGDMFTSVQFLKDLLINSTKEVGILRELYYYERAGRLEPYRLYLPSYYDPNEKYPLVVWLHGAWANWHIDLAMDLTKKKFERLAEERGYMLLCVNGYSFGFYGGGSPDLMPRDDMSEEEKRCLELCEYEPLSAIEAVSQRYSVDAGRIYLCGNSMGGAGTFWEAMRHRELFRAIAPCGAMTTSDLTVYDWTPLKDMPTLFVCGTENIGYENVKGKVAELRDMGLDAHMCTVPAAIHDDAWVDALSDIFDFFDKY